MRYLIIAIVAALMIALAIALAHEGYLPEVDEEGYRCEGDCDPDVPCRYCNPR